MLFKLTHSLPQHCYVAVSGGVDSMCGLHFLDSTRDRVKGVLHYNHGTGKFADDAEKLVRAQAQGHFEFHSEKLLEEAPKGESKEAFWREKRYAFFSRFTKYPIVTCHQLNDCVEEYLINKLVRFSPKTVISYFGPSNTIRPFRTWKKDSILAYAKQYSILYVDDPSNQDARFVRNNIRMNFVPYIYLLNPGIFGQVEDLVLNPN